MDRIPLHSDLRWCHVCSDVRGSPGLEFRCEGRGQEGGQSESRRDCYPGQWVMHGHLRLFSVGWLRRRDSESLRACLLSLARTQSFLVMSRCRVHVYNAIVFFSNIMGPLGCVTAARQEEETTWTPGLQS